MTDEAVPVTQDETPPRLRHAASSNIVEDVKKSMEGVQKRMKERMFPLYTKPIQRQKWGDHQLHPVVNWGDLFFDLFYVGMAYNLGNIIRESPTTTGLLYFCGCFVGVLHIWLDKMYYDSRFYTRDWKRCWKRMSPAL